MNVDMAHVDLVSMKMLSAVEKESVGYSLLGALLSVARLCNPEEVLTPDQETDFITSAVGWVDAYFSLPLGQEGN